MVVLQGMRIKGGQISGSSTSTGSFGRVDGIVSITGDASRVSGISIPTDSVSGSAQIACFNISGSFTKDLNLIIPSVVQLLQLVLSID